LKRIGRETSDKQDSNYRSVSRLITNNPTSLSLYIPRWNGDLSLNGSLASNQYWTLDPSISKLPALERKWPSVCHVFELTQGIIAKLVNEYILPPQPLNPLSQPLDIKLMQHAMVLAHIAAQKTDDPKIGVGAVLVNKYVGYSSVGWNSFPKHATATDYPQYGADDTLNDETLKYDYILHAEQNALMWYIYSNIRRSSGIDLDETIVVSTKMPCDECSPIMSDLRIKTVVTNKQIPKRLDDPSRLRGLSYHKIEKLIENVWVFPGSH
jgi:deoxycytidylate deaminase